MNSVRCRTLLVALFTLVLSMGLLAQGKITGEVKDASTGEAIIGANVIIEGTVLGGAADDNGVYFILNVPPGTFTVVASAVGYARSSVANVRVGADQIVTVNFMLQSEAIGLEEVVVQAQARVVDPSQTSARTRLSSDEFQSLPIREVYDLVATSPSVYKGFVRGGKQFETKTIVDGIDLTDQFYASAADNGPGANTPYLVYNAVIRHNSAENSSMVNLNAGAVEEANVLTGGIGADYSSATAGVISYSLREGRGDFSGGIRLRMSSGGLKHHGPDVYNDADKYIAEKAATQLTDPGKASRYTWNKNKYSYGEVGTYEFEASGGGNLTDELAGYLTAGLFDTHGRLPGEKLRRLKGSAKVSYAMNSDIRFTFVGMLQDQGRLFGWKNRVFSEDYRFFLEGVPQYDGVNYVGSVKMTHVLSPSTFYDVQLNYVSDNTRRGYVDGDNDGVIEWREDGDFLTFADTAQVNRYMASGGNTQFEKFFSPTPRNESGSETTITNAGGLRWKIARPGIFYEDFTNSNITLKGNLVSQMTRNHQLRAGLQLRFHNLDRELRAGYIGGQFPAYKNYVEEVWNVKPTEMSLYAEDRMEYAGLIINVGARLDALSLNAADFANYFGPFQDVPDADGGMTRVPVRGDDVETKYFLSPRVGVSHPISDQAAMYFSFSRQTQSQPFSRLFSNYGDFGNPSLPVVVHTGQDPIKSTNYDLGVQWSPFEGYGLDVSAYYRDIENYGAASFQVTPRAPWRLYLITTTFGYADSRGVEVTIRKAPAPIFEGVSLGGRISYAYSYIKQAVSAGGNTTSFSTVGGDSAKYGGELPWDAIRFFNTIEQNIQAGNSTLTGGYDRPHRITYTLMMTFPFDIMLSSVGRFESGFYYRSVLTDPRARELAVGPWTKQVDVRLEKVFDLPYGRASVFLDILNVFDWENVLAYDNSNVGQLIWERTGDPTGGPSAPRPVTQDGSMIFDIPREIYFGLTFNF